MGIRRRIEVQGREGVKRERSILARQVVVTFLAVGTERKEVVFRGVGFAWEGVLVRGAPGVERDGFEELAPAARDRFDRRFRDQSFETLRGGRVGEVQHLVGFELGADGLDIGVHALFFGDIDIADEEVNGRAHEDGDDAEDEHDFEESVGGQRRAVERSFFHRVRKVK